MTPQERFPKSFVLRLAVTGRGARRVLKTATVTVVDMISNVGGTLGLFSGVSFLSGLEVLYWTLLWAFGKTGIGGERSARRRTRGKLHQI